MAPPDDLIRLLTYPNELLSLEYKSWIDLSQEKGKAKLAKAAIALANHGGGTIVIGMQPDNTDGGALGPQRRPDTIPQYSQDAVNSAINKYADPEIHCDLMFTNHPETGIEIAFVGVPGGHKVPVMSSRTCDKEIEARRCYIRKPGPRSEEPTDAKEWHDLLDRCIRAGREDMLDAIRAIVLGHAGKPPEDTDLSALVQFADAARMRWNTRIESLPANDPARMPHGHYELGFKILGVRPAPSLSELRRRVHEAGLINHTGWSPFLISTSREFAPAVIDDTIEAWFGQPIKSQLSRKPAFLVFWRARADGVLSQIRGYDEDGHDLVTPGTCFDVTFPIFRIGEALLYVNRLARLFDGDPSILVRCYYSGLSGRLLKSLDPRRFITDSWLLGKKCVDDSAEMKIQASVSEIEDNLAEVLYPLLKPLYEKFSFFELPEDLVVAELEIMKNHRF